MIIAVIPTIFLAITNGFIFNHAHRSARRLQNANQAQASVLNERDKRLLKHMIFMFSVFFVGWVPLYIISVINWNGDGFPYIALHAVEILPVVTLLIDVLNLFLYNYDLRNYFTNRAHVEPVSRTTAHRK